MFADYVFEKSSAQYTDKVLLLDDENINNRNDYLSVFAAQGFEIVKYTDDLNFRIEYEKKIRSVDKKLAVICCSDQYIPYDIYHQFSVYVVSFENLFPKLAPVVLKNMDKVGLDLLSEVYHTNFDDFRQVRDTQTFLQEKVYARRNVQGYLEKMVNNLIERARNVCRYDDWFALAEDKAELDVLAVQYDINVDTQKINHIFQQYVLAQFGKLSQNIDKESPILVSKAMDFMYGHSDKFVVIVMDGMSEFDWNIISRSFVDLRYEKTSMFAMIPSTTSVSRQCLLSGKYPIQLLEPWKQSKEKIEFINCAKKLGFSDSQIAYERGYDAQTSYSTRCVCVIINDIDNMVHAQNQGRPGMFNDVTLLANQKKLLNITRRYLSNGYDVYITADHGNTICTGMGRLMGTGVELETKSHRALVLREFADKDLLIEKYRLIEYPKYYLSKEYDYLFCDVGVSFDAKDAKVMTHGGITLDEVVVPFVKIKAVQNNG